MQGFGRLLCNLVLIVLLQNDATAYDFNWRMAVRMHATPCQGALSEHVASARWHWVRCRPSWLSTSESP